MSDSFTNPKAIRMSNAVPTALRRALLTLALAGLGCSERAARTPAPAAVSEVKLAKQESRHPSQKAIDPNAVEVSKPATPAIVAVGTEARPAAPAADAPRLDAAKPDAAKLEEVRQAKAKAGLLAAFGKMGKDADPNALGSGGLGTGINNAIGGLKGGAGTGDLHGIGGLGSRGTGPGGGGNGLGVGGLGTKGGGQATVMGYGQGVGSTAMHGASGGGAVASHDPVGRAGARQGPQTRPSAGDDIGDPSASSVDKVPEANDWVLADKDHLSTFGADVDTASYAEARRELREGRLPAASTVRPEEFINYFKYSYPAPTDKPFGVVMDVAPSPLEPDVKLLRVGIQARRVSMRDRKTMHLTFLVDTSGSMHSPDRLPMAKQCMKMLLKNLRENDTVAIATYAGDTRDVLAPTPAGDALAIERAIDTLNTSGGTNMGSGMELAYKHAVKMLRPGEVSRVIVLTDGDANIGRTSHEEILKSIEGYVKEGVTLSAIGFGTGNYRDQMLEQLADKGNGNNFFIDSMTQARRVFEEQLGGLLEVVAKDVKFQVDFNPKSVKRYRLIGYENRDIADKDFRNDRVDSGDVGAGHAVTALFAIETVGDAHDLGTVRLREKAPSGEVAEEQAYPLSAAPWAATFAAAPRSMRLAATAALFADTLRGRPGSYAQLGALADSLGADGDAAELRELIQKADQQARAVAQAPQR